MSGGTAAAGTVAAGSAAAAGATAAAGASTIGTIASYAALAGAAASTIGSIQQGQSAANSAKYNSEIAANNETIANQNANYASAVGEQQAANQEQKNRSKLGAVIANQAASGIDVNSGSATDVQQSTAEVGQLDAMTIRANAAKQAYGYKVDAASSAAQSQLDKYQAKNDSTAGYVNAATVLGSNVAKGNSNGLFGNYASSKGFDTSDETGNVGTYLNG